MARGQHNWSEAIKAAVIAACESGTTMTEASEIYGVPLQTVSRWMGTDYLQVLPKVGETKKALDVKLEELAHRLVDAAPGKIEDANLTGTMTSFGIAFDKLQLSRNKPTTITDTVSSVEDRDRVAQEILERGKLRLVSGGQA